MPTKWITSKFTGVRYREHPTRRNGVKKDRYFAINFYVPDHEREGKKIRVEESLGWATETGMTEERASRVRSELLEAQKLGLEKALTLKEKRLKEELRRKEDEAERERREKDELPFGRIFDDLYVPARRSGRKHESESREKQLFDLWLKPVVGNLPLKAIGEIPLAKIRRTMLDAKRSPRTIQYSLQIVSAVFNFAARNGLFAGQNPVRSMKISRIPDNQRIRFIEDAEEKLILDALRDRFPDTHDAVVLSLDSGLRRSEILKLTVGDVDFNGRSFVVKQSKSGHVRHLPMTERVYGVLSRRVAGKTKDATIFPGGEQNSDRITRNFETCVKELNLNENLTDPRQRLCFHSCRHTFCSRLVQRGVSIYTVQKLAGHSGLQMTSRYSHLAASTLRDAVKLLERAPEEPTDSADEELVKKGV
jgi:integrase